MDIDGNHCNVSLILRGKNTRQCPQTTICKEKGEQERRIELKPSTCQLNAAPPGQTGLQVSPRGLNLFKGPIKAVFSYKIAPTRFKTTYRSVLTFEEKKLSCLKLFQGFDAFILAKRSENTVNWTFQNQRHFECEFSHQLF